MAQSSRFAYWFLVLVRDIPRLIRAGVFLLGIYFFVTELWNAGFACFMFLLLWKAATIQTKLEEIRDAIRGFSDEDLFAAIKGDKEPPSEKQGLLKEMTILLRDIRNNQMSQ